MCFAPEQCDLRMLLLREGRRLTWRRPLLRIARGVCAALEFLHSDAASVAHGDLRPSNILITADGEPRLCDFDNARRLGRTTSIDTVAGLPPKPKPPAQSYYIAPELLGCGADGVAFTHDATASGDIFACVILAAYLNPAGD